MKADEYDLFLRDPSGFTLKVLIPRVFGRLGVFGQFPSVTSLLMGYFGMPTLSTLALPEFVRAFEVLDKASQALLKHVEANDEYRVSRRASEGEDSRFGDGVSLPVRTERSANLVFLS
jgi:hypothetical protein